MFPFELSFIDIALLASITVLIILYVTLLLRLRPSTKPTLEAHLDEETHIKEETRIEEEKEPQKPWVTTEDPTSRQEVPEEPVKPVEAPRTPEKLFVPVENQGVPEEPVESFKFPKVEEKAPLIEPPKPSSTSPSECPHYFGYLKKLPKNLPIPDECLGCLRIVECLHSSPIS